MAEALAYDDVVRMLRGAAAKIRDGHETLSRLDAATGDGDHGTSMRRAMEALEQAIQDASSRRIAALLHDVGWAIVSAGGGATGPLLGAFFMGMSEPAGGRETLDAPALADLFEAALADVRAQTKAKPGDKTMLDAMVPAVEALRAAAGEGQGPTAAMARAAQAAETGAAATTDMQARFGKAKNLGPRSVGSADPGATSMSFIFRGFADALAARST
jgi:dihydroxyacetone kinase-like protein